METKKRKLTASNLEKIAKGATIAMVGALLTYLTDTIPNVDFGQLSPIVMVIFSTLVQGVRKYIADE